MWHLPWAICSKIILLDSEFVSRSFQVLDTWLRRFRTVSFFPERKKHNIKIEQQWSKADYYVENLTRQRHDRVQTESQELQTCPTVDSCLDLVGSRGHRVVARVLVQRARVSNCLQIHMVTCRPQCAYSGYSLLGYEIPACVVDRPVTLHMFTKEYMLIILAE